MKFLARGLGLLLVAAGFIGLVIDGTRSIVNNEVALASLGTVVGTVFPGWMPGAGAAQRSYPWLWDPVAAHLFQLPASLTGFLLGALLLWLGQKPMEPIGYMAGR